MTQEEAEKLVELFRDYIKSVVNCNNDSGYYFQMREFESELVQKIVVITGGVMGKPENVVCPDCGGAMKPRQGQYGTFWGCLKFPNCKGTRDSMGRSKAEREAEKRNETSASPRDFQESERQENHSAFSFNNKKP